jgi:uncharacterized protein YbjT (DUF2867 family)
MILVTGATGNVGRTLVDLLDGAGAPVRAVSRSPHTAGLPTRVDVVAGDPARPETIVDALQGVSAIFLNPRAVAGAAPELLALAAEHGVKQVVVLSAINVEDDLVRQPSRYRGDRNRETEDAAVASGLDCVVLRPSVFATNTLGLWGAAIRRGDVVHGPYAESASAPIHERDIAAVAARALLGDIPAGTRLDLTGPQSLTQQQMITTLGEMLHRPLHFQEVPPETAREAMVGQGFPDAFADAYLAMLAAAVGRPARTTAAITEVLGRPAAPFASWVAQHVDAFRADLGSIVPRR